jgi:hypothetical protein
LCYFCGDARDAHAGVAAGESFRRRAGLAFAGLVMGFIWMDREFDGGHFGGKMGDFRDVLIELWMFFVLFGVMRLMLMQASLPVKVFDVEPDSLLLGTFIFLYGWVDNFFAVILVFKSWESELF